MNKENLQKANQLATKIDKVQEYNFYRKIVFGYDSHSFFKYKTNINENTEVFDIIEEVEEFANTLLLQKLNKYLESLKIEFSQL